MLRKLVMIIFLLSLFGGAAELLLIEHFEGIWQLIPLSLMTLSLLTGIWFYLNEDTMSRMVFRSIMALCVVSGLVGIGLHFKGNIDFELEMYPDMKTGELIWESLKGATPALAPGTMIALGLLGWAYTLPYQNPG